MFFPKIYSKPVLIGIVGAADSGWSAICSTGEGPTSFPNNCPDGSEPGGIRNDGGILYTNPELFNQTERRSNILTD